MTTPAAAIIAVCFKPHHYSRPLAPRRYLWKTSSLFIHALKARIYIFSALRAKSREERQRGSDFIFTKSDPLLSKNDVIVYSSVILINVTLPQPTKYLYFCIKCLKHFSKKKRNPCHIVIPLHLMRFTWPAFTLHCWQHCIWPPAPAPRPCPSSTRPTA